MNYKNDNDDIYELKLAKDLKTLTRKFTCNSLNFDYVGYNRDMNLIFVKQNEIWYYQNIYFISYNNLLKANCTPSDQVIGRLINNFFKKSAHADNNVITIEDLYRKMNNERKKILIRTGQENEDNFRFRRNTDSYVSYKRYTQRFTNKVPNF